MSREIRMKFVSALVAGTPNFHGPITKLFVTLSVTRSICPGRILADSSVFIMCAMALAVFDVTKTVENGLVIDPPHVQTTGTI